MIPLMAFQDRSLNGPVKKAEDFDLEFSMKIRELVSKYEIKFNAEELIADDKIADAVFNAGVELLADIGLYHLNTQRVVTYTKEEILEFVNEINSAPANIKMGRGKDEFTIAYRTSEDTTPPALYGGAAGAIEEYEFIPFVQSFAQESSIKGMGISGGIVKVGDIEPKAGTISEIVCAQWEQEQLKEVLNRVGRPDMSLGLLCTASTVGATMQCVDKEFRHNKNTHIGVHVIPEQKIDWDRLLLSHFCHDQGIVPWQSGMSLIGGLCRDSADAAVGLMANVLGHISYAHGRMCSLFPTTMSGSWANHATIWTTCAVARACARNLHISTGTAIAPHTPWGRRPEGFIQTVLQAIAYTASGLGYAWIAGGSGFETARLGDVMDAAAGMSMEKANQITLKMLKKFDEKAKAIGTIPDGPAEFQEIYDLETVKPKEDFLDAFNRIRDELADLGMPG